MKKITPIEGNFFEDFEVGQKFIHGVPRTITEADASLYLALTGSRYALYSAHTVARETGFSRIPLDNLLVFHVAFGKTVNDISLNAVANLGYAELRFCAPCYAGDTLEVSSQVIGLKSNSSGKSGIVWVHSQAFNQNHELVVSWKRWVMVKAKKPDPSRKVSEIPSLHSEVKSSQLMAPDELNFSQWRASIAEYQPAMNALELEKTVNHRDGMTINDSDHSMATRLYQNNAQVHFDQHMMQHAKHGQRLVYGGHIISIARSLAYTGLGNACWLAAINGGSHANPSFAGDTIYAETKILALHQMNESKNIGAVRLRTFGLKNATPEEVEQLFQTEKGKTLYDERVVLDLDYWMLMPLNIRQN